MTEPNRPDDVPEEVEAEPERTRPASALREHVWLVGTLLGAAALAVFVGRSGRAAEPASARGTAPSASAESVTSGNPLAPSITGKIVERLDVPNYTYLALDTGSAGNPTWVAVTSANVRVGDSVRVLDAQLMTNFSSATLKRTFPSIYFGMLESGTPKSTANPASDPHAGVPGAPPLGGADPHARIARAPAEPVAVGSVPKAEGPNGRSVRETFDQRAALAGKSVRVRGVVVKVVTGVLGRTFVHVRDGSESPEIGDLLLTTSATPGVGERVLFEGKVVVDKDFGAGYTYPVLLEDAALIGESAPPARAP